MTKSRRSHLQDRLGAGVLLRLVQVERRVLEHEPVPLEALQGKTLRPENKQLGVGTCLVVVTVKKERTH